MYLCEETTMTILWKMKTHEGFTIKNLVELLHNNLKNGCFVITQEGISLRMMDSTNRSWFDLNLSADKFIFHELQGETMHIGLNLTHFFKVLRPLKKKDALMLFRSSDNECELGIRIIPKDNQRSTVSTIRIQNIQNVEIVDPPEGYGHSVVLPSGEYHKTIKDMLSLGNTNSTVRVRAEQFWVSFFCSAPNIYTSEVCFGETEEEFMFQPEPYDESFDIDQLSRMMKISGLSPTMQIYPSPARPLFLFSDVGSLGTLSIYMKSKQMEQDALVGAH